MTVVICQTNLVKTRNITIPTIWNLCITFTNMTTNVYFSWIFCCCISILTKFVLISSKANLCLFRCVNNVRSFKLVSWCCIFTIFKHLNLIQASTVICHLHINIELFFTVDNHFTICHINRCPFIGYDFRNLWFFCICETSSYSVTESRLNISLRDSVLILIRSLVLNFHLSVKAILICHLDIVKGSNTLRIGISTR